MHRGHFTTRALLHRATTLAALMLAVHSPARAQKPSSACGLLQVAEIESAVGGKAKTKLTGENSTVPGMSLDTCSIELTAPGSDGIHKVWINIVKDLPMDGGQAITVRNGGTAREQQWTTAGARLEQKTVGTAVCITYGRPQTVGHTICSIPRGKGYLEIDVTGDVKALVPIEAVSSLAQKAFSRL